MSSGFSNVETGEQLPTVLHARVVTGTGGGPEKTILNSPRFLEPLGFRGVCAYLHPPGDPGLTALTERATAARAPLHSVPDSGPWDRGAFRQLLKICRDEQVQIWHGHDYKTNLLGLLLSRYWPMHLVTTVHGWVSHTWKTPLYYRIDRMCLRRYQRVLCVSSDLYQECLKRGVPQSRCLLVENGIDTGEYGRIRTRSEARQQFGLNPHRRLLGAVGRLAPEKGFDILIRAVADLVQSGQDVELAIAGEGDARPALERLIADSGLSGRVHLLGFQNDLRIFYQSLDVFVLSSLREGLPNVLLEAMACRVPVVATEIAGVPRLVIGDDTGLLVPPADSTALVHAIRRLLADDKFARNMADRGQQMIAERYDFQKRMERIAAVYRDLCSGEQINRRLCVQKS